MAMKKVEMEHHFSRYQELWAEARLAKEKGLYHEAVEKAKSSWEHIDGMMQYSRKYNNEDFDSIESIDLVIKYAPLLFDHRSIDAIEALLKDCRRIERDTLQNLSDNLSKARGLMSAAHQLWNYLEQHSDVRQDSLGQILGGNQSKWRYLAETWDQMGVVRQLSTGHSCQLTLMTRMGEVVSAKCSRCGVVVEGPKAMFLEELICSECQNTAMFVILNKES